MAPKKRCVVHSPLFEKFLNDTNVAFLRDGECYLVFESMCSRTLGTEYMRFLAGEDIVHSSKVPSHLCMHANIHSILDVAHIPTVDQHRLQGANVEDRFLRWRLQEGL